MMQKNTKGACTLHMHNIVEYTKPNLFIYKEHISSLSFIEAELLVSLIHLATLKGKYTMDMSYLYCIAPMLSLSMLWKALKVLILLK